MNIQNTPERVPSEGVNAEGTGCPLELAVPKTALCEKVTEILGPFENIGKN